MAGLVGTVDPGADAEAAATRAGVEIETLAALDELADVHKLVTEVWRPDPQDPPLTTTLLRALAVAGNYVAGAYRPGYPDGELVGVSVGFFAAPPGRVLHSHVTGVPAGSRGRGVGRALKLHQRAWAAEQGLTTVTWTYDPLVARNAYFNLVTLGAGVEAYLVNHYGALADGINAGQGTDRLRVGWEITAPLPAGREAATAGASPALVGSADGHPVRMPARGGAVRVKIPADVEGLRARDPAAALAWRREVRDVLGGLLAAGGRVTGFSRSGGYLVDRGRP